MTDVTNKLPTIIIVHPKERRSKCTVEPLRSQAGFEFHKFTEQPIDIPNNYFRLGLGAEELSANDSDRGLLILDGTWRYANQMEHQYLHVPVRTLPAFQTAYPRVSKIFDDPDQGLATIEAVYAAHLILGRDTDQLFDKYHFADKFMQLNQQLIQQYSSESGRPV